MLCTFPKFHSLSTGGAQSRVEASIVVTNTMGGSIYSITRVSPTTKLCTWYVLPPSVIYFLKPEHKHQIMNVHTKWNCLIPILSTLVKYCFRPENVSCKSSIL